MQFDERPELQSHLSETVLNVDDYKRMRLINRMLLTSFFSDLQSLTVYSAACNFSEVDSFTVEQENTCWCDDVIDEEAKLFLSRS